MTEIPLELEPLKTRLRALFTGLLAEARFSAPEDRERNFLSRSLAAYAVLNLAGCSTNEAADSVMDGGGDGGIDALHYAPHSHTLWIVQSKFIAKGSGEPDSGDNEKFLRGVENLLYNRWDAFDQNTQFQNLRPMLRQSFAGDELQVRAVIVYSSVSALSEDRKHSYEGVVRHFNHDDNYLRFAAYNLTSISDWLTEAHLAPGVEKVELELRAPGWVKQPYETLYGLLPISELHRLKHEHGDRLIAANIRRFRGTTEVNDQIMATAKNEPEHFFYLNNGLTAYCEKLQVNHLDRANVDKKAFTAHGFSIVNGAQTLGSIHRLCEEGKGDAPKGWVFLKVISLERCEDDRNFAERITRSTNFQNQINDRDFISLDANQQRLCDALKLHSVNYHFKKGEENPPRDETNFDLEEAITALACLQTDNTGDLCARVLANRNSLRTLEEDEGEKRSRYKRLFGSERSARTVWRAVQTQRAVVEALQNQMRTVSGVQHEFYENARWLVLHLIFLQHHPERGEELNLPEESKGEIRQKADALAETLWQVCRAQNFVVAETQSEREVFRSPRHLRSVFCSAGDCRTLRNRVLEKQN